MALTPKVAMGTTLKKGLVAIGGIKTIAGLELSAESIDVTTLDTVGGYKAFITGSKDAGEVKISGFLIAGSFDLLRIDFEAGTTGTYTLEFADKITTINSKWAFSAVITKLSTNADVSGAVSFECTFKVSGQPTFTIAS